MQVLREEEDNLETCEVERLRTLLHKLADAAEVIPRDDIKDIRCNFTESIGRGSFADVYKGVWGREPIAIKVLRHELTRPSKVKFTVIRSGVFKLTHL